MTQPTPAPAPPAPTPPGPPAPTPPPPPAPTGQPPAPGPSGAADPVTAAELARLQGAIEAERALRRKAETDLAAAQRDKLPDAEKALADAREEGRKGAARAAGLEVAAAEFRAAAKGKLADDDAISAALALINLAPFVDDDGKVDRVKLTAAVDALTKAVPAPNPGRVPAGPQGDGASPSADDDYFGKGLRTARGGAAG